MRIPRLSAWAGPPGGAAPGARYAARGTARVLPAGSLDCFSRCTPNAYRCMHCTDLACWEGCSGGDPDCLAGCLAS